MFTIKAVRVFGFTGVVGAMALLQACAPSEDANVGVNQKLNPQCLTSRDGSCTGDITLSGDGTKTTTKDGTKRQPPMPPDGYEIKYSKCTNYVEGDAKVRTNSRIAKIADDGTIPLFRVEPIQDGKDNVRRIKVGSLPKPPIGGSGVDRATGKLVKFVKIGQVVQTKSDKGVITQWVIGSWSLGAPVRSKLNGRLQYHDTCFRNAASGKDTAGTVTAGEELAATCVVEDINTDYNAMSAATSGYWGIFNYADTKVGTAHDPIWNPHPDVYNIYEGTDGVSWFYSGMGAAMNDINGTERDEYTNYYVGEWACHMIVDGGYEVPGAKRPSTRSLPAPGIVNTKTNVVWRPVNPNVDIANQVEPAAPDPIEPAPEPVEDAVPESDTVPM